MVKDFFQQKIVPQYDKSLVCCFTGNRTHKLPWKNHEDHPDCIAAKQKLARYVDELISNGYKLFISGMARGGDTYFAEAVLAARAHHPDVALECALPCPNQADGWTASEQARYRDILDRADFITMVSPVYTSGCMIERNHYMTDKSSAIITMNYAPYGGTAATIRHAAALGLRILPINEK